MKCTLFVIDDDDIFNRIVEIMVQKSKTFEKVAHFNGAKDGLQYLRTHQSDASMLPDVLFVDLNMPITSGWELLDELQHIYPSFPKRVAVYIVTTGISLFESGRAEKYNFVTEFISKPLQFDKLRAIYQAACKNVEAASAENPHTHTVIDFGVL